MIGAAIGLLAKSYFELGAVTTVDINSQKVFQDVAFSVAKRFITPASGGTPGNTWFDIVFDATSVNKEKLVLLPIAFKGFGGGPLYIDVYAGGTYGDDGDLVDCYNRDNTSSTTCEAIVTTNPTITTIGTKLPPEFVLHSNGTAAVATLGGEVIDDLITILRKDVKYLIRITNQENRSVNSWFGFNWFEVDETP